MAKKKTDASQNTGADNGVTSSYKNDTGSGKNTGRSGAGNGNKALPAPKRAKTPGDPDSFSAQIVSVIFWVLAFLLSVFFIANIWEDAGVLIEWCCTLLYGLFGYGALFARALGLVHPPGGVVQQVTFLHGVGLLRGALARTARLGLRLRSGGRDAQRVGLVEVHELDDAHVGSIAQTESRLQDAGVTARALGDLRGDRAEELRNGLLLFEVRKYDAARVGRVLLRLGYQRLHELLYSLSLGYGGLDALVQNQRRGHVRKHCLAVSRLTAEVVVILIVSH